MDDSLMPNDGELFNAFQEPEEQVLARRVSQSKAQAAKPMLEDLIALFANDIEQLNTVDSIPVDIETDTAEFMTAWKIRQEMLTYARNKKSYLESLLETVR